MKNLSSPLFVIVLLLSAACGQKKQGPPPVRPIPVPVVEVPLKTVTGYSTYPVSIEGTVNSAVRAKVSGYITKVMVDEGQRVKKGQTLFTLETQSLSQEA